MNKKLTCILIIFIMLTLYLGYNVFGTYINKIAFEKDILNLANKNEETLFSINNITLFSSADSNTEIQSNASLSLKNLFQYTDIAIFLTPNGNELTYKNTLKNVYIDNIKFVTTPEVGTPTLYYKNLSDFATSKHLEENKIDDNLNFNISSEDNADLNTPTLYNNCANPITLSYINNNIKTDFTLADASKEITYDGSLLKKCSITLNSIECAISFDIHITNNLDQNFICPIYIKIPLESEDGSNIYDGKVQIKNTTNYTFYRYN